MRVFLGLVKLKFIVFEIQHSARVIHSDHVYKFLCKHHVVRLENSLLRFKANVKILKVL